jgi:diguanylate cyclase (GGDEF)-like protein
MTPSSSPAPEATRKPLQPQPGAPAADSLSEVRQEVRRERLIDMEHRMRRYRHACFGILVLALLAVGPDVGWFWVAPLGAGLIGFAVADRFMHASPRPEIWLACAWGVLPLILAAAVLGTGSADSPALIWFALPAVTLGVRFEPRGMVFGTAYILVLFFLCTVVADPTMAAERRPFLVATAALILCAVVLSGALVESDRAHRRRSTLDPLTGLFNRNALEQRLAELEGQQSSTDGNDSTALLLCDLDHFKRVNDQLGHAAGDAVLQDVAYVMRATLRAGDSIYRVGGEEILVILPGAGREEAVEISERLRVDVRDRRPVGVQVTVSIGVALTDTDPVDTDRLVARADAALYAAKAGGRDTVSVSEN